MIRWVSVLIGCCISCIVCGQISVTGGFSKDTVQLGEEVAYTITTKVNNQVRVLSVDLVQLDSIISLVQTKEKERTDTTGNPGPAVGDYNIISTGLWEDSNDDKIIGGAELNWDTTIVGNEVLLENTFMISFWDVGPNVIMTPEVVYRLGGISSAYRANTYSQIFVDLPFEEQELSDSVDIAPIRNIIVEEKNITDYYPLFYALGVVMLLPVLYLIYKKLTDKEPVPIEEVVEITPAHQIALEKLQGLRSSKLWEQGEVKEYQTQLTYTIREYLENRYEIQALESSTDEIVKALKESKFDPKDEVDLKTILQVADLVKFAKAKPSAEIHEEFLNTAFTFVEKTKSNEPPKTETRLVQQQEEYQTAKVENSRALPQASGSSVKANKVRPASVTSLISKEYTLAGFWRRLGAHTIDINIVMVLFVGVYYLAFMLFQMEEGELTTAKITLSICCFLITTFIYYAYPQYRYRKTLGKKLLSIEVVNYKYENISLAQSIGRVLVRILEHLLLLLPYLSFFFTKKKQTVHDLLSKTLVIKKNKANSKQDLLDVEV